MIDDLMDEPEYDEGPCEHDDRLADQRICHECKRETAGESCGFCGNDLCPACFEMGGGFCSVKHTQEQIDAYEDEAYPPANAAAAAERKRQRVARDELRKMGGATMITPDQARAMQARTELARAPRESQPALLPTADLTRLTPQMVANEVCQWFSLEPAILLSRKRPAWIAWPRQIAMALSYELCLDYGCIGVGLAFKRTHGAVLHAIQQVNNRCQTERITRELIDLMRTKIIKSCHQPNAA